MAGGAGPAAEPQRAAACSFSKFEFLTVAFFSVIIGGREYFGGVAAPYNATLCRVTVERDV